jgi:hypothetical protein
MAESSGSKREAFIGVGGQPQDYGAHGRPAKLAASPARAAGKADTGRQISVKRALISSNINWL